MSVKLKKLIADHLYKGISVRMQDPIAFGIKVFVQIFNDLGEGTEKKTRNVCSFKVRTRKVTNNGLLINGITICK